MLRKNKGVYGFLVLLWSSAIGDEITQEGFVTQAIERAATQIVPSGRLCVGWIWRLVISWLETKPSELIY